MALHVADVIYTAVCDKCGDNWETETDGDYVLGSLSELQESGWRFDESTGDIHCPGCGLSDATPNPPTDHTH